jgi:hypothetical protein
MLLCLSVKDSRETLDDLDDLLTSVALESTELDQLADTLHDDTLLRSPCHRDAAATLEVEETFLTEEMQGPQHGVLVHAEDACHVFGQWEPLSGPPILPRRWLCGSRPPPDREEALSLFGRP